MYRKADKCTDIRAGVKTSRLAYGWEKWCKDREAGAQRDSLVHRQAGRCTDR